MLVTCSASFASGSRGRTSPLKNRLIGDADLTRLSRVSITMICVRNKRRRGGRVSSCERCSSSKRHLIWTSLTWLRCWLPRIVRFVFFVHQAVCSGSCRSTSLCILLKLCIGIVMVLLGELECVLMQAWCAQLRRFNLLSHAICWDTTGINGGVVGLAGMGLFADGRFATEACWSSWGSWLRPNTILTRRTPVSRSWYMPSFRRVDIIGILAYEPKTILCHRVNTLAVLCLAVVVSIAWCYCSPIALWAMTGCVNSAALTEWSIGWSACSIPALLLCCCLNLLLFAGEKFGLV